MEHRFNLFFPLACCFLLTCNAQSVFDRWQTVDDRTGSPKAVVRVFEREGKMFGQIERVLEKGKENAVCIKCEGKRKNQPIAGMYIIEGLEKNKEEEWKGNTLLDPEQGRTFRCKIWLDPKNPDHLKVRGYLSFFYRTQTWLRLKN